MKLIYKKRWKKYSRKRYRYKGRRRRGYGSSGYGSSKKGNKRVGTVFGSAFKDPFKKSFKSDGLFSNPFKMTNTTETTERRVGQIRGAKYEDK